MRVKDLALEGLRLLLVLLFAFAVYLVFVGFAAALECKERPEGGSYWSWRLIDGQRCWYRGERVHPKSDLHWPEQKPKEKKIKSDPVMQIRADTGLDGVTWYQRRPFDEAAPIWPPLFYNPDDVMPECCWPDLSQFEFEQRFVGMQ